MPKIIIGLTGSMASGKETVKQYLEKNYQANSHRFSTVMRDILKRMYLPVERANLQKLSFVIREAFGSDVFAKVMAQDAKGDNSDIVVIDGIRRFADIASLKDLPSFYLTAIETDPKIRYQRLVARNENPGDDKKTWEQFQSDDQAEAEQEIPAVIAKAKFKLDNNGDFNDLYKQIDKMITELL